MFSFPSAYVVALDIYHTSSKSIEKINSNGGIVELMSTLTRAHQTAKQACLACILGSLPGYGTKDLTASGDNSLQYEGLQAPVAMVSGSSYA